MIEKTDEALASALIILIPLSFPVGYLLRYSMPQYTWTATPVLFAIMFCSTYGLTWHAFLHPQEHLKPLITGMTLQLTALPLIALGVTSLFYHHHPLWQVGHLCVAASPAAISTIIWSRISGGDVALGILAVGAHVLLIPITAPIILKLTVGKSVVVPLLPLAQKLFIAVLLPTILALIAYHMKPMDEFKPPMGIVAKIGMLYMIVLNTSVAALNTPLSIKVLFVLGIMALQVSLFYATGTLAGHLLRLPSESRITITYYLGMKNNGAALVMALAGFPPQATLPVALAIACQQPIASVIDRFWRHKHAEHAPSRTHDERSE